MVWLYQRTAPSYPIFGECFAFQTQNWGLAYSFSFRHMCHDENVFSSPLDFNPDRFLVSTVDPKTIIFGFGRRFVRHKKNCVNRIHFKPNFCRRCPGVNLADTAIWLVIATVLANFDILPPLDPVTNEPLVPTKKFTSASTRYISSNDFWHFTIILRIRV